MSPAEYGTRRLVAWAPTIRRRSNASTCPWEIHERLPDGRERFVAAYQTLAAAEAALQERVPV